MSYKKTVAYIAQGLLDLFRNIQNILFAAGIFTHNPQGMAVNPMKNSTNDKINQKKVKQTKKQHHKLNQYVRIHVHAQARMAGGSTDMKRPTCEGKFSKHWSLLQ